MGGCRKGAGMGGRRAASRGAHLCHSWGLSVPGNQLGYIRAGREVAAFGEGGGCILPGRG